MSGEEVKKEIPEISLIELLEKSSPNVKYRLSDSLIASSPMKVDPPKAVMVYCKNDDCKIRTYFDLKDSSGTVLYRLTNGCILYYECRHCKKEPKVFAITLMLQIGGVRVVKTGEFPAYNDKIPTKFNALMGSDRETFLKGFSCEKQGLGIGAFAYYRRILEVQKDRVFDEIIKVCKTIGVSQDVVEDRNVPGRRET